MIRMPKRFVALARVSSREQQREGFSLDVQVDAFQRYADDKDGEITKLWKIAETASKKQERTVFREVLAYAKKHAGKIDGLLFMKVDRAARNLFDYVELERLEADYDVPVIYITQPTENTPAGRMMRRTLANMAAFYTEQQSLDVRDGIAKRVEQGLFPQTPPYGYRTRRVDGRSIVEVDKKKAKRVRLAFDLYAHEGYTLDSLIDELDRRAIPYTDVTRRFPRSKLYALLQDRSYLGDIRYHGQWHPGTHEPLIDRKTFDRVQAVLGGSNYRSHELTYAGELITCGHCGSPITGECKTKKTKSGEKQYRYYRCAKYNKPGHPRVRLREEDLDRQVIDLFRKIKINDPKARDWFARSLQAKVRESQKQTEKQTAELNRQLTSLRDQQDRLLNLRLMDEIDKMTYAAKNTELRDRIAELSLQLDVDDRSRAEKGELALKMFELSQTLEDKWFTSDYRAKRRILEMACLNFSLHNVNLDMTLNKVFSALTEDLVLAENRGGQI